ncbi:hypothetical protein HYH02_007358 [Chlamydomonas schloesseri]|uniref:RING-type domain-containing protein n=1 Tax=Chlamydomonas schloesseri TaxID=2026947 RepID=A0A835WIK4_9CHLO|nr:hypothetical protein HYH02_007358 [Chlamydomonas schloesseri]|eukprot:KAG2447904.1 hypothetical protein HYH02_007358 [Chlamydomonas schloesseri]
MDSISENLRRAQEAIARARALSTQLSSLCLSQAQTSSAAAASGAVAYETGADERGTASSPGFSTPGSGVAASCTPLPPDGDPVQRYRTYLESQSVSAAGRPTQEHASPRPDAAAAVPEAEAAWSRGSWRSSHQRLSALGVSAASAAAATTTTTTTIDAYGLTARSAIPRHHSEVELELEACEADGGAASGGVSSNSSRAGRAGGGSGGRGLEGDGSGIAGFRGRGDGSTGGGSDPGTSGGDGEGGGDLSARLTHLAGPVLAVATQLASLQRKQSETLQQLLVLRMQQLKLRQQQLTALQELLTAEMAAIEGTPLQVSAVEQAVGLLGQSLRDMKAASRAMLLSGPEQVAAVSAAVSATDSRADEVSRMARQLLGVLRAFPRRGGTAQDHDTVKGAAPAVIAAIPTLTCEASSALVGQTCCICLGAFEEGDALKSIQCVHYHHAACLDEWLAIKACCPLCKAVLPG